MSSLDQVGSGVGSKTTIIKTKSGKSGKSHNFGSWSGAKKAGGMKQPVFEGKLDKLKGHIYNCSDT